MSIYVPGTAVYQLSNVAKGGTELMLDTAGRVLQQKRLLNAGEYAYYYSFLDKEDVDDVVKAAIAVVLDADLKAMYLKYYSDYKDPLLKIWIDVFKDLKGEDRLKALAEINAFDNYLYTPEITSSFQQQAASSRQVFVLDILRERKNVATEVLIQEKIEEERKALDKGAKHIAAQQKELVINLLNKHIKENLPLYLDTMVEALSIKDYKGADKNSKISYLKAVTAEAINKGYVPKDAIANFRKGLDYITSQMSDRAFSSAVNRLFVKASHPIARFFR